MGPPHPPRQARILKGHPCLPVETEVVAHDPISLDRSQCTSAFTPVPMPLADSTLRSDEPRILMGGLYGDIPRRTGRHVVIATLRAVSPESSPILRGIADVFFPGARTLRKVGPDK